MQGLMQDWRLTLNRICISAKKHSCDATRLEPCARKPICRTGWLDQANRIATACELFRLSNSSKLLGVDDSEALGVVTALEFNRLIFGGIDTHPLQWV